MKIHFHIERLLLAGLALDDHRLLGEALKRELRDRLTSGGLAPQFRQSRAVASTEGGSFELHEPHDSAGLGREIANAVCRGIAVRQ